MMRLYDIGRACDFLAIGLYDLGRASVRFLGDGSVDYVTIQNEFFGINPSGKIYPHPIFEDCIRCIHIFDYNLPPIE